LWKVPRRIPYPVTVSLASGRPPPRRLKYAGQCRIAEHGFCRDRNRKLTLDRTFVRSARRYFWRFAMADGRSEIALRPALVRPSLWHDA
jgi:hypothetical protein